MDSDYLNPLQNTQGITCFENFFFIHNKEKYAANSLLVSSVSPVIRQLLLNYPEVNSFALPSIPGPISDLINLFYGGKIEITPENCRFYKYIGKLLGIKPLVIEAENIIRKSDTLENILTFANQLIEVDIVPEEEVRQIASNFYLLDGNKQFKYGNKKVWELILNSSDLAIESMEQRLKFIVSLIEFDPKKYGSLITSIKFEELNEEDKKMLMSSANINFNPIKYDLISTIRARKSLDSQYIHYFSPKQDSNQISDGVISYLNFEEKTIQQLCNKICLSCSSQYNQRFGPANAISIKNRGSYYSSLEGPNDYLMISFLDSMMQISHYAIRPWKDSRNLVCPKDFVFYGSEGGKYWEELDRQTNCVKMIGSSGFIVFKLKRLSKKYTSFKIEQIDNFHPKNKRFAISGIDFYGIWSDYSKH